MTSPILENSRFDFKRAASAWKEFQPTKLYNLLAALPLIGWFGLSALRQGTQVVAGLNHAQSGPIDTAVVISLLGTLATFVFIALLLVLVVLPRPAKARAIGLMPRLSAFFGTYLGIALVWLPQQRPWFQTCLLPRSGPARLLDLSTHRRREKRRDFPFIQSK